MFGVLAAVAMGASSGLWDRLDTQHDRGDRLDRRVGSAAIIPVRRDFARKLRASAPDFGSEPHALPLHPRNKLRALFGRYVGEDSGDVIDEQPLWGSTYGSDAARRGGCADFAVELRRSRDQL